MGLDPATQTAIVTAMVAAAKGAAGSAAISAGAQLAGGGKVDVGKTLEAGAGGAAVGGASSFAAGAQAVKSTADVTQTAALAQGAKSGLEGADLLKGAGEAAKSIAPAASAEMSNPTEQQKTNIARDKAAAKPKPVKIASTGLPADQAPSSIPEHVIQRQPKGGISSGSNIPTPAKDGVGLGKVGGGRPGTGTSTSGTAAERGISGAVKGAASKVLTKEGAVAGLALGAGVVPSLLAKSASPASPKLPGTASLAGAREAENERRRAFLAKGRRSTLGTPGGARGLIGGRANVGVKTLLGA